MKGNSKLIDLFKIHDDLVCNLDPWIKRGLFDDIDWSDRLIGIKGSRGVGKTTFLLNYAKKIGKTKKCLYVDLNDLYFSTHSIAHLAEDFQKLGGNVLLLDQVYKYPDWSNELRYCYDNFPELQVVFTGSPVMRLKEENPQLDGLVKVYSLEGFSFREYLNYKASTNFQKYSFEEVTENYMDICAEIVSKVKPLAYFNDYLHHGFYPYTLRETNVYNALTKSANQVLEIEISYIKQMDQKCLPKLRKLLYLINCSAPFQPNVSKLASEIDTSRATVMNYMVYLKQARLIHLLYQDGDTLHKKPAHIYMQNPNLMYLAHYANVDRGALCQTFFFNQLGYKNEVTRGHVGDFCVGGKMFKIGAPKSNQNGVIFVQDMQEVGLENMIPLWLFGFLY